ncbi:PD40 domain-containing protein, partial [bacterium]|nr:PD40 domain-containing protein [candidate division CSSED10-310 bacterium]
MKRLFPLLLMWVVLSRGMISVGYGTITPHKVMVRYPDVSARHIVFCYADDIWLVPREGGMAVPLASPNGGEMTPKFSPDGENIAFSGDYDGTSDLYTLPVTGGVPFRVTHHPAWEQLNSWTDDGRLIYSAWGAGSFPMDRSLYIVPANGGQPQPLPVLYGGNGTISSDGTWLAFTPFPREHRAWKRYMGGRATDIWLLNLKDFSSQQVTEWGGTDSMPMWHGHRIYYLSDGGPSHFFNIWVYDIDTGKREQLTHFTDFDVEWPSIGPGSFGEGEIVFQHAAGIKLLNLETLEIRDIEITIPGDRPTLQPIRVDASKTIKNGRLSS